MAAEKRKAEDDVQNSDDSDECIGPMPTQTIQIKKKKVLPYEKIYLDNLPKSEGYEKSYMHRDVVTHIAMARTDFLMTASCDGHVKFWKKLEEEEGIEFVKHYRSHLGTIVDMSVSLNGELACTISDDKTMKVFDIINFDMINMNRVEYVPGCCCWLYSPGDAIKAIAVSDRDGNSIHIYDGQGGGEPLHTLDKLHYQPVSLIRYNSPFGIAVSVDKAGMMEYWMGPKGDYTFPKNIQWEFKTDTDLYEFAKNNTVVTGLAFSPDGKLFATISRDRKVRVFKFLTGKLSKTLDESLQKINELQQMKQQLPNLEFSRRMAIEKDLGKSEAFNLCNIIFDDTGHFILYPTMLGVKVVNLHTNRCVRMLGKTENIRILHISLFQGACKKPKAAVTIEMQASDNPALKGVQLDPTLFCTAYKKNRFYMFTRRAPDSSVGPEGDRDVFNEKPSKEEMISATQDVSYTRIANNATIHTTMGDIHLALFPKECPKSVENFCVHSKNSYYNSHIFHRVIKGFMIQTGDPLGNGTGGESIWGGEFEDEFHSSLRHDRPYMVCMANAGPNTNGSQFFIIVAPTPWLDNKHTVFGRVVKGMEVVSNISNANTNPKTDKPHDDIRIISITVK